ncbi:MAG: hypothetical protein HY952_08175 [Elusimicrobia bacterium]|nr:hypothetical protein [Elusimicrobiota bacterium]
MKKLIAFLMVIMPAGAQAMEMGHGMGMMRGPHPMGVHFTVLLYGILAALGYFVLQHAVAFKEPPKCFMVMGRLTGMVLIIVGLLGIFCGVAAHVKMAAHQMCRCSYLEQDPALTAPKGPEKMPVPDPKLTAPKAAPKSK